MMVRLTRISSFAGLLLLAARCNNVSDVKPTERITFIKTFEKGGNYTGVVAEPLLDGYIMGSVLQSGLNSDAYITKLDVHGNQSWEISIPSSTVSAILSVADGYLVFGDGIQANDTALNINDRVIASALLTKIGLDGQVLKSAYFSDPSNPRTDFHGTGITLDGAGNIVTAGNKKESATNALSVAYIAVYSPTTLDTLWTSEYGLIDQDFINAHNVFVTATGDILWSSSVEKTNLSQTLAYLGNSKVVPNSSFNNYSYFGQDITQNRLSAQEMQPCATGFGVVGTFSDGQGKNGNLFFVRADPGGRFDNSTLLFFDGISGAVPADPNSLNSTPSSETDDVGSALISIPDGGFLIGGHFTTTINRGKGGLDLWLIRIGAGGDVVWNKSFGGAGDETLSSVRTLSDGSFLIAGTSSNGLSSAFLMRIDANGELTN